MWIKECKMSIFKVDNKGKYSTASLSEGIKDKEGNWSNMYFNGKFVGKAFEKSLQLSDKDRITITSGKVETSYNKDTQKSYTSVVVFDFTTGEQTSKVEDINYDDIDLDLPF